MAKRYKDSFGADDMVDISSGKAVRSGSTASGSSAKSRKGSGHTKKSNTKKIAIITSITAAVVVAAAVAGFCIMQNMTVPVAVEGMENDYVFAEGSSVSGISIAGKTVEEAKALLEKKKADFIAPLKINITANEETFSLTEKNFEYEYNIDAVLKGMSEDVQTSDIYVDGEYIVTAKATKDSVDKCSEKACKELSSAPVNARVSTFTPYAENRFEYEEAKAGVGIDENDVNSKLHFAVSSGEPETTINALTTSIPADIQVEDIKKNVIKLASYETYSTNSENGTENMRVSLEACNGSIIEPGDTWSFNACTGNSNLESLGYKPAGVISDGQLTTGIGGGLCQSSSTIYNAAIRADMDVVERYNHKWASSYVPAGLDATIDYPNLDLKMKNPTKYQMFLECKLVGRNLYASIWGVKNGSYDEIKTANKLDSQGSKTYSVKAWRVYLKDGKEIDREQLPSSTYDSDHGIIFSNAEYDDGANVGDVDDLTNPPTPPATDPPRTEPQRPDTTPDPTQAPTPAPEPEPTPAPTPEPEPDTEPDTDEVPMEQSE